MDTASLSIYRARWCQFFPHSEQESRKLNGSEDVPLHRLQAISRNPGLGFLAQPAQPARIAQIHLCQYQRTPNEQCFHSPVKMVIVDGATGEPDVARLFTVLSELMEQTNSHRTYTAQLHAQAGGIKVRTATLFACSR
jgi:hypothetical protein